MVSFEPKSKGSSSGWRLLVVFLVVGAVLMTVWFNESDNGPLHSIRSGATVVASPIREVGAALGVPFAAIGNAMTNITAETEDLLTLQEKNDELTSEVSQLEEYKQENERLTELLNMTSTYGVSGTGARIIGRSVDNYNGAITIDKGSLAGIQAGQPVMDANGLLGQIDSVGPTSSVVRLLSDQNSGVSVLMQSSRVEGVLTGSAEGLLYLKYVSTSQTVNVGDIVVTSGMGGAFPKGILIGEVLSVDAAANDLYYTIVVSSVATDSNFEEVLVVDTSSSSSDGTSSNSTTTAETGDAS